MSDDVGAALQEVAMNLAKFFATFRVAFFGKVLRAAWSYALRRNLIVMSDDVGAALQEVAMSLAKFLRCFWLRFADGFDGCEE
jgi:hypothetical protein